MTQKHTHISWHCDIGFVSLKDAHEPGDIGVCNEAMMTIWKATTSKAISTISPSSAASTGQDSSFSARSWGGLCVQVLLGISETKQSDSHDVGEWLMD
jgi:hypothetical protein